MRLEDHQWAGVLLFAGSAEFAIGMTVAEALSPGYNIAHDFLGDLGVGPSAVVFNGSIGLLGLALLASAWFLFRGFRDWLLTIAVALAGLGAFGFGIVTESSLAIHNVFTALLFGFGGLSAVLAFRVLRPPFRYLGIVLGVVALAAFGLTVAGRYGSLDRGGMERMSIWPILIWGIATGGSLMAAIASAPSQEPTSPAPTPPSQSDSAK